MRKLIQSRETQAGDSDVCVFEETLSDGSKVYNVEAFGHGGYYHALANALDQESALTCLDAIVAACKTAAGQP